MSENHVFAIYSRKSKYTGKGESIGNQIEICREYIRMHYGAEEADRAVVYEDEGFSGGNLNRPRFCVMMDAARREQYRAIVVYRLDRISRNIGDFANLIRELERDGIDFISVKEQFDTGNPMGRAMMYISSVFSQLERETIAERIRDNLRELAKTGRWLGGMTPTGYESRQIVSVSIDGRQKRACMLAEIPEELQLVEQIFYKFIEEKSLTKVDSYLLERGCRTKRGNEFSRFSIRAILTNPVYMIADEDAWQYLTGQGVQLFGSREDFDGVHGIMAYNRTFQRSGKAHKIKPMEEWIVAVGRHTGRIPGRVWVEAQAILSQNSGRSYKKPRNNTALLSGVLKCGNCGSYMRPKLGRSRSDNGERRYSYLCIRKERSRSCCCMMKNADGNVLDGELIRCLKGFHENRALFLKELEKGRSLVRKLTLKERETASGEGKTALEEYGRNLSQMAVSFEALTDSLTAEQKRDAIRRFLKELIWDGENAHVVCQGSWYQYQMPGRLLGFSEHCQGNEEETEEPSGEDSK